MQRPNIIYILSVAALTEQPVYEELFDLRNDPGECYNLTDDRVHADRIDVLRCRLLELAREVKGKDGAPCLSLSVTESGGTPLLL
ncbi:MAG: hypothetical protein O2923_03980 [Verrucomicrobia bacterium]|nr:hypothetical protein [Verrucomicrobiota bacterium]MDA1086363.1 hypothetical protein [Verrucomicrobiota bacterium]